MAAEYREGERVYSPRFGRGEVAAIVDGRVTIRFEDGPELTLQDPAAIRLERIEADPAPAAVPEPEEMEAPMDRDEMRQVFQEALEELFGPAEARIADRWKGGALILKPGREGAQSKEIPLEAFFQKIIRVRDQLRVLEQKVNASSGLDNSSKIALQQYITRCYGSLTTFNVLFKDDEDRFIGGSA